MATQFRIYKSGDTIIAGRYDTIANDWTDKSISSIPAQELGLVIKKGMPDLIAFSCLSWEKLYREFALIPYNEIYDESGVLYSGSDSWAVRVSLVNAIGATSGGGGGDATAANQGTQITEAQTTNAKLDAIAIAINNLKTGIDGQILLNGDGTYMIRQEVVDASGATQVTYVDLMGAPVTPIPDVVPANPNELQMRNLIHKAINNGTGYNTNDVILEGQVINLTVSPPVITSSLWYNATQNTNISQPLAADIVLVTETGLAKETTAQAILAEAIYQTNIQNATLIYNPDIAQNTQAANSNLEQILNNQFQPTAIGVETVNTTGVLAAIGVIDCTELQYIELIVKGTFTGANLTVQGCSENTFAASPISQVLPSPLNGTGAPVAAITTTNGNYKIPTTSKFIRLNLTAIASGSLTAEVRYYKKPAPVQRVEQIAELVDNVGAKADAAATNDTGAFSLIAFIKRIAAAIAAIFVRLSDGSQKTQVVDNGGNAAGILQGSLKVAQSSTDFIFSTGNSTDLNLAAGATFTGTIETILNQQAISIMLNNTNRTGILTIQQFIANDPLTLVASWVFNVPNTTEGYNIARTANGNYFRITFQNTSGVSTIDLNINTYQGTLPPVTNLGNAPVSVDEVGGATLTLGQKTAASSLPVVQAQEQRYMASFFNVSISNPATDVLTIYPNSSSRAARILSVKMWGTVSLTSALLNVSAIKRLASATGGTSTLATSVPLDSSNTASNTSVRAYTANPTPGPPVGTLSTPKFHFETTGGYSNREVVEFINPNSPVILRSNGQGLVLSLNSTGAAGMNVNFEVLWEEF